MEKADGQMAVGAHAEQSPVQGLTRDELRVLVVALNNLPVALVDPLYRALHTAHGKVSAAMKMAT